MPERESWDQWFMSIAFKVAERATCLRRQVGAVAVLDKRIIATGYNGAPSGVPHCTKETCYRIVNNIPSGTQLDMCIANHAEANLVCQAATSGISLEGSTIYVTYSPCITCTKLLISCKVHKVVYKDSYPDTSGLIEKLWRNYQKSLNRADCPLCSLD